MTSRLLFDDLYQARVEPILPVAGKSQVAREASASGAIQASKTAGEKVTKILAALEKGPLSRQQLHDRTGVSINSMCSLIDHLLTSGQIARTHEKVTYRWPDGGETQQETFRLRRDR